MRLIFKQRMFSWLASYNVFDGDGNLFYTVKGKLGWGRNFVIYDASQNELGKVKGRVFSILPRFDLYQGNTKFGTITKRISLFKPKFDIDCNGWQVEGSFSEWNYRILNAHGAEVANIHKELFNWTDTYVIDVAKYDDALPALMLAIAIDAEKASRSN